MKTALLRRLERLETVGAFLEGDRRPKIEFAYLKQLPREYTGTRHIVTVGRRPDGREECEERPGEPPPNHEAARDQNVMRIYIVSAAEPDTKIREGNLENVRRSNEDRVAETAEASRGGPGRRKPAAA
jgi:hypothetical protein